jgi:predicted ATP-binding protein involved in virulence
MSRIEAKEYPMRIASLELTNVGVFDQQLIEFRPKVDPDKAEIHILTGINGSGKSTILYALASAFDPSDQLKKRFRFIDEKSSIAIGCVNGSDLLELVKVGFENRHGLSFLQTVHPIQRYHADIHSDLQRIEQGEFSFAAFAYSGSRTLSTAGVSSIQELTTNPLHDALNFSGSIDPRQLIQWIANTKAKVAFAKEANDNAAALRYQLAIQRIEKAIEEIVGFPVEFVFNYEPLAVHIKADSRVLEFDLLPDGLKSIISWIADLLMRLDRLRWVDNLDVLDRSFLLFLDEIEIHLHPAWQRKILPVVQKLFKNAQIFIATHSPFVVGSVSNAWVYRFDVKDGNSTLVDVEESMAGSSYTTVIDEIFGIDEYFDVETEREFAEFDRLKQELLRGNQAITQEFITLAQRLAAKSTEAQDIVGREIRQLERITNQELPL